MDVTLLVLVGAVLVIGSGLLVIVQLTAARHPRLDTTKYRQAWHAIRQNVDKKTMDNLQMAVINADKLLDTAMREYGVAGATTGERLKARRGLWSHEDAVWSAHKLRNQIAHESNVALTPQTCQRAMAGFETALKDLGAL